MPTTSDLPRGHATVDCGGKTGCTTEVRRAQRFRRKLIVESHAEDVKYNALGWWLVPTINYISPGSLTPPSNTEKQVPMEKYKE